MKQKYLSVYAIGAVLFSTLIFSCNKEVGQKTDNQPSKEALAPLQETVNVYAVLNNAFTAMLGASFPGTNTQVSGKKYKFGCADISATPGGWVDFPKEIVVDFGTEDCTLRGYQGIVRYTINQWVYEPGAVFEPEFEDFYVNGYKIDGKYKITNEGVTNFRVEIQEGVLISPDGVRFDLTGEQYFTQIEGVDTRAEFNDDVFSVTGSVSGTSSLGYETKAEIKTPLIRAVNDCDYITAGVLYLEAGDIAGDLDFGDGTCDDEGTLIIELDGAIFEAPFTIPF